MAAFTVIFAAFALLLAAVVVFVVWCVLNRPRRARTQVDALEAAWALAADEPVRP